MGLYDLELKLGPLRQQYVVSREIVADCSSIEVQGMD